MPVLQDHGDITSLGFRFGNVAYSADIKSLPAESVAALRGLDVWIVDALRKAPHPSHFNLDEALEWIARINPKRAILTNLHSDMDYAALRAELPPAVEPAYDLMSFVAALMWFPVFLRADCRFLSKIVRMAASKGREKPTSRNIP